MVSRNTTLVPSLGLRIGPACEAGLSVGMRRERVPPQRIKIKIKHDVLVLLYTVLEKRRDRQYFGHNFDEFKYIVVIFCKKCHKVNAKLLTQEKSASPNQCRYFTLRIRQLYKAQSHT